MLFSLYFKEQSATTCNSGPEQEAIAKLNALDPLNGSDGLQIIDELIEACDPEVLMAYQDAWGHHEVVSLDRRYSQVR